MERKLFFYRKKFFFLNPPFYGTLYRESHVKQKAKNTVFLKEKTKFILNLWQNTVKLENP
jgi:hypothetical protein